MKKIPTLFRRDPDNMRGLLPIATPGCEWVLEGEGVATRKYDGTCVMFDGTRWWARREVRPGKQAPANYQPIETDSATGKTVGWEPIEQSAFARWHAEALAGDEEPGTYELCGPKINGNREGFELHTLIRHADAEVLPLRASNLTFDRLAAVLPVCGAHFEGVVWHHPDGRMAKLKVRDFHS